MKETSTIYDAFVLQEQQRYEKKHQDKHSEKNDSRKQGLTNGVQKKKTATKAKKTDSPRKQPFEDAIKKVNWDKKLRNCPIFRKCGPLNTNMK